MLRYEGSTRAGQTTASPEDGVSAPFLVLPLVSARQASAMPHLACSAAPATMNSVVSCAAANFPIGLSPSHQSLDCGPTWL